MRQQILSEIVNKLLALGIRVQNGNGADNLTNDSPWPEGGNFSEKQD